MLRRTFDILCSLSALACLAPVMLLSAVAIRLSSAGPVFYPARRVGRDGRLFTMLKLRTMHCRPTSGSSITASNDPRVFPVGRLLRAFKIDELPQLWNVVRGDMAIVGPRPEAPDIVDQHYTAAYRQTLRVRPGLTSPGSIFYYTHGEQLLHDGAAEQFYAARLLPVKMRLDQQYLDSASLLSDLGVILQTASVLIQKACGREKFPVPFMVNGSEFLTGTESSSASETDSVHPGLRESPPQHRIAA